MPVLSLELNELNFQYVKFFVADDKLPNFAKLLEEAQLVETRSEKGYPHLEPWIQWPTIYSGKTFAEHGVFRLGDIVHSDHEQIWEQLEAEGLKVGAVSPMNAANRCEDPEFFLPDPWTQTEITADERVTKLFKLIRDLVNNNASSDVSIASVGPKILALASPYLQLGSVPLYLRILKTATSHKFAKAAFLDCLLTDLTISLMDKKKPDFVSLFLNAGAHIQHHHMYDSNAYDGGRKNPDWYSSAADGRIDPLLFIYEVYDTILGRLRGREDIHLMLSTGLSQIPNERAHYQYRFIDYGRLCSIAGLPDSVNIETRMSRDFVIASPDEAVVRGVKDKLALVTCDGKPFFTIEDRATSLFCQVGYFGPPEGLEKVDVNGTKIDLSNDLVLVSIENGIHQTTGYHIDCSVPNGTGPDTIPLVEVHQRLKDAAKAKAPQSAEALALAS